MDSLDLNVHSAILTSLAQCYATSSANEEPVAILAKLSALSLSDGTSKSVSALLPIDFCPHHTLYYILGSSTANSI
jgi:hypothetical protein